MSISRSKSTTHIYGGAIQGPHSREQNRPPRAHLSRSKSVLGHRELTSSPVVRSPSGEREDPFNLSNFFPSHLGLGEWGWLQDETNHIERSPTRSGYTTPFAEEDEWMPATPPDVETYNRPLNGELAEEAIQREDKLGILTFGDFLASPHAGNKHSNDQLVSPYSEYDLTDDEALYHALSAQRVSRGRATEREAGTQLRGGFDELFAAEAASGIMEGLADGGYSLLYGGIRGAMDLFDTQF
ncbi:uncharacterized protein B0H18DRAFT_950124 [Fomitopsis serialis]|uniref:uncharacterized protein n=1 Tax=Fomitopsis serialis TaxID=139415 RepID=UPI002008D124|nr:uncharacterized protein B0H18DRAFT_950124 [Neoantrodia serialis]KAH9937182.1 hypothetical protein B0H18DRAFT_950124 [Neoantrodia serialis]